MAFECPAENAAGTALRCNSAIGYSGKARFASGEFPLDIEAAASMLACCIAKDDAPKFWMSFEEFEAKLTPLLKH